MSNFYLELYRLAKNRQRSKADYYKFQQHQAEGVHKDIKAIFDLPTQTSMIDLGCGNGGYTESFGKYYDTVVGVDYFVEPPNDKSQNITYINSDILTYQHPKAADFIFCASVIEHIEEPEKLILSIRNNLKPGGLLYLSFPPFYSIGGGHQLKPLHYLPEKMAIGIGKKWNRIGKKVTGYHDMWGTWGLYKRDINQVKTLLQKHQFEIIKVKPRYFRFNTAVIPIFKNLLTWHAEFYCRKI